MAFERFRNSKCSPGKSSTNSAEGVSTSGNGHNAVSNSSVASSGGLAGRACRSRETKGTMVLFGISWILPITASILYITATLIGKWEILSFDYATLAKLNDSIYAAEELKIDTTAVGTVRWKTLQVLYDDSKIRGAIMRKIVTDPTKKATQNLTEDRWCLLDMHGGIWDICDYLSDVTRTASDCTKLDQAKTNKACFNYINQYGMISNNKNLRNKEIYFIKMHNNVIACVIMVYICSGFSFFMGMTSMVFKLVLCAMVTSVLFAMAALFSIFGSAIQQEKLRLLRNDKACNYYTPLTMPSEFCPENTRTSIFNIVNEWPISVTWVAAVIYILSTLFWAFVTRNLRLQQSKSYI